MSESAARRYGRRQRQYSRAAERRRMRSRGNSCRGKARYASFDEASAIGNPIGCSPYPCTNCGCFHLTSHPRVW